MTAPEVAYSLDHLGALAAHWVLGWEMCADPECDGCGLPVYLFGSQGWRVVDPSIDPSPGAVRFNGVTFYHFAEDIGDAWRLVDKLAEDGYQLSLHDYTPPWWRACFARPEFGQERIHCAAKSAPAAIALAALAATGHPVRLELGEEG